MLVVEVSGGQIESKLGLTKLVKSSTGWSLKESKDWVDGFNRFTKTQSLEIIVPESEFIDGLEIVNGQSSGFIKCYGTSRKRDLKLLKLGVGDKESKVKSLSNELSLISIEGGLTRESVRNIFENVLGILDEKSIDNIVNNLDTIV